MTVSELLAKLAAAYPAFNAKAAESFAPVFRARFAKFEGPILARAFIECAGDFVPGKAGLFPVPKTFENYLPGDRLKLKDAGKKLDFPAQKARKAQLLAAWRLDQGRRASAGNHYVKKALEFFAEQQAGILAWQENPKPVLLTKGDVRKAQQRAISQERYRRFGKPTTNGAWWAQIETIADEWRIPVDRRDWAWKPSMDNQPVEPTTAEIAARVDAQLAAELTDDQKREAEERARSFIAEHSDAERGGERAKPERANPNPNTQEGNGLPQPITASDVRVETGPIGD